MFSSLLSIIILGSTHEGSGGWLAVHRSDWPSSKIFFAFRACRRVHWMSWISILVWLGDDWGQSLFQVWRRCDDFTFPGGGNYVFTVMWHVTNNDRRTPPWFLRTLHNYQATLVLELLSCIYLEPTARDLELVVLSFLSFTPFSPTCCISAHPTIFYHILCLSFVILDHSAVLPDRFEDLSSHCNVFPSFPPFNITMVVFASLRSQSFLHASSCCFHRLFALGIASNRPFNRAIPSSGPGDISVFVVLE